MSRAIGSSSPRYTVTPRNNSTYAPSRSRRQSDTVQPLGAMTGKSYGGRSSFAAPSRSNDTRKPSRAKICSWSSVMLRPCRRATTTASERFLADPAVELLVDLGLAPRMAAAAGDDRGIAPVRRVAIRAAHRVGQGDLAEAGEVVAPLRIVEIGKRRV